MARDPRNNQANFIQQRQAQTLPSKMLSSGLEFIKETISPFAFWKNHYSEAPPRQRHYHFAYVEIYSKHEKNNHPPIFMGSFSPEFYRLACQKNLSTQLERNSSSLGKSNFELSVLRWRPNQPSEQLRVEAWAKKEYNYRIKNNLPLPTPVPRTRAAKDFLNNIMVNESRAELGELFYRECSIQLNLKNSKAQYVTKREKLLHLLSFFFVPVLTLVAISAVTPFYSPSIHAALGTEYAVYFFNAFVFLIGMNLYERCKYAQFELVENLNRDISGLQQDWKWFWRNPKNNIKELDKFKVLKTIFLLSLTALITYATGMTAAKALPIMGGRALAFISGLGALLATLYTQKFNWGIGLWKTQVPADDLLVLVDKFYQDLNVVPQVQPNPPTVTQSRDTTSAPVTSLPATLASVSDLLIPSSVASAPNPTFPPNSNKLFSPAHLSAQGKPMHQPPMQTSLPVPPLLLSKLPPALLAESTIDLQSGYASQESSTNSTPRSSRKSPRIRHDIREAAIAVHGEGHKLNHMTFNLNERKCKKVESLPPVSRRSRRASA